MAAVVGYTHAPFPPKFLMDFCSDRPCECSGQKSVALPISEIIAIVVLDGVANLQSWGTGGHRGRGWYRSKERW